MFVKLLFNCLREFYFVIHTPDEIRSHHRTRTIEVIYPDLVLRFSAFWQRSVWIFLYFTFRWPGAWFLFIYELTGFCSSGFRSPFIKPCTGYWAPKLIPPTEHMLSEGRRRNAARANWPPNGGNHVIGLICIGISCEVCSFHATRSVTTTLDCMPQGLK